MAKPVSVRTPVGALTPPRGRDAARASQVARLLHQDTKRLQALIDEWVGSDSRSLRTYQRHFQSDMARTAPKRMRRDEALRRAAASQIVYCGDDHSARGAQSVCLDLLRTMSASKGSRVILVLELAQSDKQRVVDGYLRGDVSLADFEKQVFARGALGSFHFDGYARILEYAKEHGIKVIAADTLGSLAQRDAAAAQIIARAVARHPNAQLLVHYGQLHLANAHLPARTQAALTRIGSPRTSSRVLTSEDTSYFRLLREGRVAVAAQLDTSTFCVFGVRPRASRKSYLRYLEGL